MWPMAATFDQRELSMVLDSIEGPEALAWLKENQPLSNQFILDNRELLKKIDSNSAAEQRQALSDLQEKLKTLSKYQFQLEDVLVRDALTSIVEKSPGGNVGISQTSYNSLSTAIVSYFSDADPKQTQKLLTKAIESTVNPEAFNSLSKKQQFLAGLLAQTFAHSYETRSDLLLETSLNRRLDERQLQRLQAELKSNQEEISNQWIKIVHESYSRMDDGLKQYFAKSNINIEPPHFKYFLETFLPEYFLNMSTENRRGVLLDILSLPSNASTFELLGAFMQNSGPQMQKLLQSIAREEGLDPDFAKQLQLLESSVKEEPFEYAQRALAQAVGPDYQSVIQFEGRHALGWGTLAGTYPVKVKTQGAWEPAVIRLLKNDIESKIVSEYRLLQRLGKKIDHDPVLKGTVFENFTGMLEGLNANVVEELNAAKTAAQQQFGNKVYINIEQGVLTPELDLKTVDVAVPGILDEKLAQNGILLQARARGTSPEKYFKKHPEMRAKIAEDLARLWAREAFFLSGFHHADLHFGNIMIDQQPGQRPTLYILDFGMTGLLSADQRASLMLLERSLQKGKQNLSFERAQSALFSQSRLSNAQKASLEQAIVEQIRAGQSDVNLLIVSLAEKKLPLDANVISLNRGYLLVDQMLRNSGSKLTLGKIIADAAPWMFSQDLKKLLSARRIPGYGRSHYSPLRKRQLFREFVWTPIKSCPRAMIRLLRGR